MRAWMRLYESLVTLQYIKRQFHGEWSLAASYDVKEKHCLQVALLDSDVAAISAGTSNYSVGYSIRSPHAWTCSGHDFP